MTDCNDLESSHRLFQTTKFKAFNLQMDVLHTNKHGFCFVSYIDTHIVFSQNIFPSPYLSTEGDYIKMFMRGRPITMFIPSDVENYDEVRTELPPERLKLEWVYPFLSSRLCTRHFVSMHLLFTQMKPSLFTEHISLTT